MTNRTYKGWKIYECESAERSAYSHNGRWILQTYHQTGVSYADALCPHFSTLKEARWWVDAKVKDNANMDAYLDSLNA